MKEYQRKMIIECILKDIEERNIIKQKRVKLADLEVDPKVVEYLNLIDEIKVLEKKYENYDSDEKLINKGFDKTMDNEFKCEHGIWFFRGSNYLSIDFLSEHDHSVVEDSEDYPTEKGKFVFLHNEYMCLECGTVRKIEKKDIRRFEESNYVLRSKKSYSRKDSEYYQNLLYQSLYCHSFEEAFKIVVDTFNKNDGNNIVRTLHK